MGFRIIVERFMIPLSAIEMDTSIQCRAAIDPAVVNEYAERMAAGDKFPPVDVFGSTPFWIGDGWHRIMGARQIGALMIDAVAHEGGRREALKHALGANAQHGHRRSNADKRRSLEIVLVEFPGLSSRAMAALCGVSKNTVTAWRVPPSMVIPKRSSESKLQVITQMLGEGNNPEQIAGMIGTRVDYVRDAIREHSLGTLTRKGNRVAHIDVAHVLTETVNAVAATGHGLRLIRNAKIEIPKTEAAALLADMTEAMQALRWLVNVLKELSYG